MNELRAILDGLAEAGRRGESAILATVVGVQGSAYRRPGARLLLLPDGRGAGAISGGCLEADVIRRARQGGAPSGPFVLRYDTTSDEEIAWELGLGCGGVVDVLVERVDPVHRPPHLAFLRRCLDRRHSGVLARVVGAEGGRGVHVGDWLALEENGGSEGNLCDPELAAGVRADAADVLRRGGWRRVAHDGPNGRVEVFYELLRPPPWLLVCGAGHDAPPVARLAGELGWRVTVCDRRPALATRDRFPGAEVVVCRPPDLLRRVAVEPGGAAVVMTHDFIDDQCFLEVLLPLPLRYIGILGARRRTQRLLRNLAADGPLRRRDEDRLYGPVGLDIGAETPGEIALAVVAEVQAVLAGRAAGFLRDLPGPIHDPRPHDGVAAPWAAGSRSGAWALRAE